MEMGELISKAEEDVVCVGAQQLVRLHSKLRIYSLEAFGMVSPQGDNRLAAIRYDLQEIICTARTCRHTEHLADEPLTDGQIDRIGKVVHAAIVDWWNGRR